MGSDGRLGRCLAEALRVHIEFIEGLKADDGETPGTVRRRLGDVSRLIGNELVIKKDGAVMYFGSRQGVPIDLARTASAVK